MNRIERFLIASEGDVAVAAVRTRQLPLLRDASEVDRALIATIVSELGTNIVKYAGRGFIGLQRLDAAGAVDIEIVAEDSGPGIVDIQQAMADHFSTGGSLGLGLPGVRRMADEFTIASQPRQGTRIVARKRVVGRAAAPPLDAPPSQRTLGSGPPMAGCWDVSCRVRAHPGELRSGDQALVIGCDGGLLLAIIDASGHGERAHQVSTRLVAHLQAHASADLQQTMAGLHAAAQGTLGAAVGLAFADAERNQLRYLAVGNTRVAKLGAQAWRGVSRDGVLGERLPTAFEQTVPLSTGDCVILWTDGLPDLATHALQPSVSLRSADQIARRFLADSAKPYDDAGCVVMKWLK